jgi:hypothetical protein
MAGRSDVSRPLSGAEEQPSAAVYVEGLLAGALAAATIAGWFLVLDLIAGHPFYTPTVLGTALFRGGAGLGGPTPIPVDYEMVVSFTWVHLLAFLVIGLAASKLIELAERDADVGFGIVLLAVVFEFGFILLCVLFAEDVLQAISWPAVLVGNLLAATVMGLTFWRRHPRLVIRP